MIFQEPKARLSSLIKAGWRIQTGPAYNIPAKIKAAGFKAIYYITDGDEIIGFFI